MTFAQSKRSFVLLVVVLTALAATCLDLAAAAAAAVTPAGAAPVSTKAPSDLAARIRVLAGDPDHVLVGVSRVGPGRHAYRGSERVYVVDQHGHRDGIGRVGDFETGWSVNGDIVTSVSGHFDAELNLRDDVHWWDLGSGTSGVVHLSDGQRYAAASHDGFYFTVDGWVFDRALGGDTSKLARPFPHRSHPTVASVHRGFVASGARHRAMLYRAKSGSLVGLPGHTDYRLSCGPKLHGMVACQAEKPREDEPSLFGVDLLVVRHHRSHFRRSAGTTPVVTDVGMTYVDGHKLRSLDRHGRRTTSHGRVDAAYVEVPSGFAPAVASAFGDAVLTRHHHRTVVRTSHAGARWHVVRDAGRSAVTTSAAALGDGRIAWVEDSGPGGTNVGYVADVDHGDADHASRLAGSSPGEGIAVSDTTVAYLTRRDGKAGLKVATSAGHPTFIAGVVDPVIDVSGDQVLYFTVDDGNDAAQGHAHVYDAASGVTQQVGPTLNVRVPRADGWDYAVPAALADGRLTYQLPNGSVINEVIATHETVTLRGPGNPGFDALARPQVFADGDFAGWNRGIDCGYRNVVTLAPAVNLTAVTGEFDVIDALTSAGVIYHNRVAPAVDGESFSLAPYGGASGPVVLAGPDVSPPSVNGTTIAWVDRDGVVQAAPFTG